MILEFRKFITRSMLKAESDALFVFGDNISRIGLGGQAAAMRGEVNAVGIPTKHSPHTTMDSYFNDTDYALWVVKSGPDWTWLFLHKGLIVWPEDGIGTGRARLVEKAPRIYFACLDLLELLKERSTK